MPRPPVHPTTLRVYDSLPEFYRDADEAQTGPDYPLLRFLSLILDQLGDVEDLIDRVDYVPSDSPDYDADLDADPADVDRPAWERLRSRPSELVDPNLAAPAWLPWLAQLVGISLDPRLDVADQRGIIAGHTGGWSTGTREAIAAAARTALTGDRYVDVRPTAAWDVTVYTSPEETPSAAAVLAAVEAANVRPAGVRILHSYYAASWDTLEARYTSWDALEAGAPTWSGVESTA